MSDRLDEFQRQRALQREHLDWIDREIASMEGAAQAPEVSRPPILELSPSAHREAEAILEEYRKPAVSIAKQTRTGCVIYFVVAVVLLALAVGAMYLYARSVRGR